MTKCELRIISGARSGQREVFEKSYIGLGRHPLSDVRFDAEKDLDASTRHAAIVKTGESYVLRDLGSTNGTFVNGEKLDGERPLRDGDTLKFGLHGPEVTFNVLRDEEEVVMPAVVVPPRTSKTEDSITAKPAPPARPAPAAKPKPRGATRAEAELPTAPMTPKAAPPSKTSVLRAEVGAQRSRARALTVMLGIIIAGALGVVYWQGLKSNEAITGAVNTVDSLRAELATLQRPAPAGRFRAHRAAGRIAPGARSARPGAAPAPHHPRRAAQRRPPAGRGHGFPVHPAAERRRGGGDLRALPDTTQMFEATAFSVNPQGLMITNRHNVLGRGGEQPRDIAIRFNGSTDVHPARFVRALPDADLAVIQLESQGPFPAVVGPGIRRWRGGRSDRAARLPRRQQRHGPAAGQAGHRQHYRGERFAARA